MFFRQAARVKSCCPPRPQPCPLGIAERTYAEDARISSTHLCVQAIGYVALKMTHLTCMCRRGTTAARQARRNRVHITITIELGPFRLSFPVEFRRARSPPGISQRPTSGGSIPEAATLTSGVRCA